MNGMGRRWAGCRGSARARRGSGETRARRLVPDEPPERHAPYTAVDDDRNAQLVRMVARVHHGVSGAASAGQSAKASWVAVEQDQGARFSAEDGFGSAAATL